MKALSCFFDYLFVCVLLFMAMSCRIPFWSLTSRCVVPSLLIILQQQHQQQKKSDPGRIRAPHSMLVKHVQPWRANSSQRRRLIQVATGSLLQRVVFWQYGRRSQGIAHMCTRWTQSRPRHFYIAGLAHPPPINVPPQTYGCNKALPRETNA